MAGYTFEAVGHLFHYFGFSMAIGGSIAALKSHKKARTLESDQKLATESMAADIVLKSNSLDYSLPFWVAFFWLYIIHLYSKRRQTIRSRVLVRGFTSN